MYLYVCAITLHVCVIYTMGPLLRDIPNEGPHLNYLLIQTTLSNQIGTKGVESPMLSHTLKIHISTFECNWSYESPIEMGIVSEVSSHLQQRLS